MLVKRIFLFKINCLILLKVNLKNAHKILTLSKLKKMNKVKKVPLIRLDPESDLAIGLIKMLEHKKLREKFWSGEINLEELNKQLKEKNINKQYEHSSAV
jgi:hypothetical protein